MFPIEITHRKNASSIVFLDEILILELSSVDTRQASSVRVNKITSLNHKILEQSEKLSRHLLSLP